MVTYYGCTGGVVETDTAGGTVVTGGIGLLGGGAGRLEDGGVVTFAETGLVGLGGVGRDF